MGSVAVSDGAHYSRGGASVVASGHDADNAGNRRGGAAAEGSVKPYDSERSGNRYEIRLLLSLTGSRAPAINCTLPQ